MTAPAILRRLYLDTPFLVEGALAALLRIDIEAAEHPGMKNLRDRVMPQIERVGSLAIVPVTGVLARKPDPFEMAFGGVEDTDAIRSLVETAAADPDVAGILMELDSPGGFYKGGPELADAIRAADAVKPVVSWTGGQMSSLAYWAGSQASQVIASRSATVGSIGSYIALYDVTKLLEGFGVKVELFKNREADFKAAGLPGTSLTDAQRSHLQTRAQDGFDEFRRTVKATRRPDPLEGRCRDLRFARAIPGPDRSDPEGAVPHEARGRAEGHARRGLILPIRNQ